MKKSKASKRKKKHAAFISYAAPDERIAKELHELFAELEIPTFYAKTALPPQANSRFCKSIVKSIQESSSFVEIFSRNSLARSWVLYESGIADCLGLQRFLAGVGGVRPEDSLFKPGDKVFVNSLCKPEELAGLVLKVFECHAGKHDQAAVAAIREKVLKSEHTSSPW